MRFSVSSFVYLFNFYLFFFFFFLQGKPVGTPDAGAFFRVLSEHGASSMFTTPTAIRAIRQQDPDASIGRKFPLSR